MEALPFHSYQDISSPAFLMNVISANSRAKIRFCSSSFRVFRFSSLGLNDSPELTNGGSRKKRVLKDSVRVRVKVSDAQLKENWLASLSSPFIGDIEQLSVEGQDPKSNAGPNWTIGIDPDVSGALALLKSDDLGCSAQVFDTPHLHALVGKSVRRRLDARAIVQLLQSFEAPLGTTAYIEQSIPYPQDGKQGWWGGGFGYGLWIGILVASGFSVVPVPSALWKHHFELSGNGLSKDDSRRVASALFPSVSSLLKRKKDHGRAEALLIAAYGKGLGIKSDPSIT